MNTSESDRDRIPSKVTFQFETTQAPIIQARVSDAGCSSQNTASPPLPAPSVVNRQQHYYDVAAQRFRDEFVEGSGITPSIYTRAVRLLPDFQVDENGDPEYPIRDALNWTVTRFGAQANRANLAAGFMQENGLFWQLKLARPILDKKKGGFRKYENPKVGGSRAYLPPLDFHTWYHIAKAHHLTDTLPISVRHWAGLPTSLCSSASCSFWDWLESHPQIPIVITEGGKKAQCLLSHEHGAVAIALTGVNGGYQRMPGDTRRLIPDIERFCHPLRPFTLAFDQDIKPKTRKKVELALKRFGGLLERTGAKSVTIATWAKELGKGVDDLIVQNGVEQWQQAYLAALSLTDWAIILELQHKLSVPANITLDAPDLSRVDIGAIPETGIIGIASAKGTGKTKAMAKLVDETGGNLNITHRRALGRNLAQRMGLEYRDAVSNVNERHAVDDGFYRLGIVGCVDWLMAIQPNSWVGCTLFVDEVTQVIRHLLTSSTCAQDGKRPILLARFRQLIAGAKRVIVADADLDNQTLHYLQELRGDGARPFLIRNDYQPTGYPVRYIESKTRDAIVQELLDALTHRKVGEIIYVAFDSKALSKHVLMLVEAFYPEINTLLVNSDTSGAGDARAFIEHPASIIASGDYQLILGTPSIGTGVSIEPPINPIQQTDTPPLQADLNLYSDAPAPEVDSVIWRVVHVFGMFSGVSCTDSDMAQALDRVREPVQRTVWCAAQGSAFSKLGTQSTSLELKAALKQLTDVTTALVRSQLREDNLEILDNYDWQSDPHINLWAKIEADRNRSMMHLGDRLRVRLQHEGNHISCVPIELDDDAIAEQLKLARELIRDREADEILLAPHYNLSEVLDLSKQQTLNPEQKAGIAAFWLREFYCVDELDKDLILEDKQGQRRAQIASLEHLLYPQTAMESTIKSIDAQLRWNCGNCPWDISGAELRRKTRETLGLLDFLTEGWEWGEADIAPYAERIRRYASDIKVALNMTINNQMSDTQVVHQLLSQLGLRTKFRWTRKDGVKQRIYRLNQEHWQAIRAILNRRLQRRWVRQAELDHPPNSGEHIQGGDPAMKPLSETLNYRDVKAKELRLETEADEMIAQLLVLLQTEADSETVADIRALLAPYQEAV